MAAVVVTYNRAPQLHLALDALLEQPFAAVVVVDNCSTDETADVLAGFDDQRLIVRTMPENVGGAGGFHEGCRVASGLDVDWVVLQDDDARPAPDFFAALSKVLSEGVPDDVGGLAAAVRSPDGDIVEMNRPSVSPFRRIRDVVAAVLFGRNALHIPHEAYVGGDLDVDCVAFVGYVVRRDLIGGELGLPRAEFFIYADDQAYSYRVRELGYRNVFKPSLRYVHDCATYDPTRAVSPLWKVYYLYRNSLEFYRQIAGRKFVLVVPLKAVAWTLRLTRYERGRRLPYLRVAARGFVDGLRRRFDVPHADVVAFAERALGSGSAR